jgi:hypothetical protein
VQGVHVMAVKAEERIPAVLHQAGLTATVTGLPRASG